MFNSTIIFYISIILCISFYKLKTSHIFNLPHLTPPSHIFNLPHLPSPPPRTFNFPHFNFPYIQPPAFQNTHLQFPISSTSYASKHTPSNPHIFISTIITIILYISSKLPKIQFPPSKSPSPS